MRVIFDICLPSEPFNSLAREGEAGSTIRRLLEQQKPEAVYFTTQNGQRCALLVADLQDASEIPAWCEPWFLSFDADIDCRPAMSAEDLARADVDGIVSRWT